jgi:hypothetical protein
MTITVTLFFWPHPINPFPKIRTHFIANTHISFINIFFLKKENKNGENAPKMKYMQTRAFFLFYYVIDIPPPHIYTSIFFQF